MVEKSKLMVYSSGTVGFPDGNIVKKIQASKEYWKMKSFFNFVSSAVYYILLPILSVILPVEFFKNI